MFVRTSLHRLEQLQLGRSTLCFGRIDTEAAEAFYIGRLAVSDADQEPLVVDWRAPVAEAFYRATGRNPMGTVRRRHFATDRRTLLGIEDELFRADGEAGADDLELVGPGALLAALERSRSGHMRDIVATVQREQDEIIRAELPGLLVVQGGPGTGKTAVALHRAAYLLYTHRFPLEQQGVLVIGPNQVFLRYIEQVLPSLGESGVVLTTLAGLVADIRLRPGAADPSVEVERIKGDARMVQVLARAVGDRQRPLPGDLVVGFGSMTLRLAHQSLQAIVSSVKRRPGTHNARRRHVEVLVGRGLFDAYRAAMVRAASVAAAAPADDGPVDEDGEPLDQAEFTRLIRRHPTVVTALDRMWPLLSPGEFLHDLFGAPALLRLASRGVLSAPERALLERPRSSALDEVAWSPADLALVDEARALLGPRRWRRSNDPEGDGDGELRTYGHILVDEAQDLSPMALRMVARRSLSGSITLVGDIGQATSPWAPSGWDEVLAALPRRRGARVANLTVNYRTPAEIMAAAIGVLAAAELPDLQPPRSVRATGRLPVVRTSAAAELAETVAAAAADELGALATGTVAVIAPEVLLAPLAEALRASGVPWGEPDRSGLSEPVTLLGLTPAKGLEFDAVVVVEPAGLVAESTHGMRALFVALTRTTRRLTIVHADPLPDPLQRGLELARASLAEAPSS